MLLVAGVVSLLLGFAAAGLWAWGDDLSTEFSARGSAWEIACRSGRVWLDNAPQIRKATEPQPREQALRQTLYDQPWDSPRYRAALAELRSLVAARQSVVPHQVEYSFPLWLPILAALPTLLWLTSLAVPRTLRLKDRHLAQVAKALRVQADQRLFTIAAATSLVLLVAASIMAVRSFSSRTAITFHLRGVERALASERGTLGFDNQPEIDQFFADRSKRVDALRAEFDRESSSALFVVGIRRTEGRNLIHVNSRWLAVGDTIESDGVRIRIAAISLTQIVVIRDGKRITRRMGESLKTGLEDNRRVANIRLQMFTASRPLPPRGVRHAIPYWMIAVGLAILPALWLAALCRRQARLAAGGCIACGYNLTGNTSGVCPECGMPVAQAPLDAASVQRVTASASSRGEQPGIRV